MLFTNYIYRRDKLAQCPHWEPGHIDKGIDDIFYIVIAPLNYNIVDIAKAYPLQRAQFSKLIEHTNNA